jgi:hypothetical protein
MIETVLKVKVDEFLSHKIENIVERGLFKFLMMSYQRLTGKIQFTPKTS